MPDYLSGLRLALALAEAAGDAAYTPALRRLIADLEGTQATAEVVEHPTRQFPRTSAAEEAREGGKPTPRWFDRPILAASASLRARGSRPPWRL